MITLTFNVDFHSYSNPECKKSRVFLKQIGSAYNAKPICLKFKNEYCYVTPLPGTSSSSLVRTWRPNWGICWKQDWRGWRGCGHRWGLLVPHHRFRGSFCAGLGGRLLCGTRRKNQCYKGCNSTEADYNRPAYFHGWVLLMIY